MIGARYANAKSGGDRDSNGSVDPFEITNAEAAAKVEVSEMTIKRAKKVIKDGVPALEEMVKALKLTAERKAGALLAGMELAKGGRGKTDDARSLVSLGITGKQSSRWQRAAVVPVTARSHPPSGGSPPTESESFDRPVVAMCESAGGAESSAGGPRSGATARRVGECRARSAVMVLVCASCCTCAGVNSVV